MTYDLKTSVMTKKQLDKYNRYRIFLRAKLGCFHANEQELQIYENGDRCQKAFYHFIRFIQYLAMGEVPVSYTHLDVYKRQALQRAYFVYSTQSLHMELPHMAPEKFICRTGQNVHPSHPQTT